MRKYILSLLIVVVQVAYAQTDIPIGTWRTHYSYNQVNEVIVVDNLVYASSQNGLFIVDQDDNSVTTLTKSSGLQGGTISALAYDEQGSQLLIGYTSGNLDVIQANDIFNFDFVTTSQIQSSKAINHITIFNEDAFIATDFGVLRFDLLKQEVSETYRELGLSIDSIPQKLKVNAATVFRDSLFIASEQGVLAANLVQDINLLDYQNWRRFGPAEGLPVSEAQIIGTEDDNVIAGLEALGIYEYDGNNWVATNALQNTSFSDLDVTANLIVADSNVYIFDADFNTTPIDISECILAATESQEGNRWLATATKGLLKMSGTLSEFIKPSGPSTNEVFALKYQNDQIFALSGGYTNGATPLNNSATYAVFENGDWNTFEINSIQDLVDVEQFNGINFFASMGMGIVSVAEDQSVIIYNESNSTLVNTFTEDGLRVPALETSQLGLWVLNYGTNRVHLLNNDLEWESVVISSGLSAFATDIISVGDLLWLIIDPSSGGGIVVVDPFTGNARYLTSQGGNGGLASTTVNTLALDKDGFVWAGTNLGVSVFTNPFAVLTGQVNAIEPIFENRQLLRDEVVTDIKIDGGNRKWVGTQRGLWLFDDQADTQIRFFNEANSPLPSDNIIDIEIHEKSGEVFIGTEKGIVSYRGTSTEGGPTLENVKIFPNPVRQDFTGTVGISGLVNDALIKITDASGKLIWRTQANGGTATWNVKDYNGNRAMTGVYYVFSSSADGEETFVGKIAIIN
ncbi:MAG: two-component regulator propeller domain-containing protein [Fulvivirga sp.]